MERNYTGKVSLDQYAEAIHPLGGNGLIQVGTNSYFSTVCRQLEADTRLADWQTDNCRLLDRKDSKTAAANIRLAA